MKQNLTPPPNRIIYLAAVTACLLTMALSLTSCSGKAPVPLEPLCTLPSGNLTEPAFETAMATLDSPHCRYRFDEVFSALVTVCKGSPALENREKFSNFLVWAKDAGIISSIKAKKLYNRYFTSDFVSLPDDYQNCSYCSRMGTILSDTRTELSDKELGLIKVCGDKTAFAKASDDLKKIQLILEAVCYACQEEY